MTYDPEVAVCRKVAAAQGNFKDLVKIAAAYSRKHQFGNAAFALQAAVLYAPSKKKQTEIIRRIDEYWRKFFLREK